MRCDETTQHTHSGSFCSPPLLSLTQSAKDVPSKKMKEYLIRMIYVEMLGHDASFGHIHAVKMVHNRALLEKRVGYLAVSLTLHKDHSFMLLLINSIQQDLRSDNFLEASMALTVVAKLVNAETIPAIMPLVVKLLDHKEGNVKKKAVMVLHRFHQIDPSTIAALNAPIRKALCDSNISVMAASLNLFLDLCAHKSSAYKDLVPDFVSILKQVIEHRLPRDYDYHRIPAPWVQLKLLQILAVLGASDKNASEGMYEILREVMKRADIGINVGYAIVYECTRTVTSIYPDPALIEDAASSISRFITSDNHNLKYLGVNALASIVQIDSKYAAEHQLVVIDLLEDPDETLKRKTLDLLHQMANPANVTVIVAKLTQYLQTTTDQYLRAELVSRINQLAEKFAPSNEWFITTINNVFELSGAVTTSVGATTMNGVSSAPAVGGSEKLIKNEMSQSILRLISENANQLMINFPDGRVPEEEDDIRTYAVDTYINLLSAKRKSFTTSLPDILLQVIAWILGEYGNLSASSSPSEVLGLLVQLMERQVDSPALTKSWILGAILKMSSKLLATGTPVPPSVAALITKYQNSLFVDLQQRSYEFLELLKSPATFTAVVPPNNTFDLELVIDSKLSFLDSYVETALKNGAKPYNNEPSMKARVAGDASADVFAGSATPGKQSLKYSAYAAPEREIASAPAPVTVARSPTANNGLHSQYGIAPPLALGASPVPPQTTTDAGLRLGNVARRWGPQGYNDPEAAAAPAATPYAPTVAAMPSAASAAFGRQQEAEREAAMAAQAEKERKAKEIASRPRELTEREKMASSLFAGVGNTAAPAPAPKRVTPVARPAQPQPTVQQQPPQPQQNAAADFLGGLIDAPPAVASKPAASPSAADSLDLLFGGATTSAPAAVTSPVRPAPTGDIFDMFGGAPVAAPTQQPTQQSAQQPSLFDAFAPAPTTAAAPALMDDPFGFNTPAPQSQQQNDLFGLGEGSTKYGAAGSHLSAQLAGLQKGAEQTLISDARVQLTAYRAYSDAQTVVALFLSNKTAAPIANLVLAFTLPAGIAVNVVADAGAQVAPGHTAPNQQVISFASVAPRSTATQLVQLSVRDLSAFSPASGPLQVGNGSVAFAGLTSPPLSFSFDLTPADFLRPAPMKTDAYGVAWKALNEETKGVARPTTCGTPAEFMSRVSAGLRAHPVQTIGAENICAARIIAAAGTQQQPNYFLVLVHGKVHSHIDLIVRSKSRELSAAVAKQLTVVLK